MGLVDGVLHQDQTTLITEVTARGPIFSSRLYLISHLGHPPRGMKGWVLVAALGLPLVAARGAVL